MNIFSIVGIALISATIIVLIKNYCPEFTIPISVVASELLLIISIFVVKDIFEEIQNIAEFSAIASNNLKLIFKALGVCYITQIATDVCVDCGQTAIADKIDFAGKITIATMSVGIIIQVVEIVLEIVN